MGGNEVANRGSDQAVVGGDPAVMAIQELIDRLPGVVSNPASARKDWTSFWFLRPDRQCGGTRTRIVEYIAVDCSSGAC